MLGTIPRANIFPSLDPQRSGLHARVPTGTRRCIFYGSRRLLGPSMTTRRSAVGGLVPWASADSGQAAGEESLGAASHGVGEVYENQRWLAGWQQPIAILDHPPWSDADGNAVLLEPAPSEDSPDWEIAVTPSTDEEGWQYGTVFKHLQNQRRGGRSSQRFGDSVRRRAWRRWDGGEAGIAVEPRSAAVAAFRQREAAAQQKAIKAFIGLVFDLLSRRKLWTLVPWDPAALYILFKAHRQALQELRAQAYRRRLFTPDGPSPPSLMRERGTMVQDLLCAAMHARAAYGFAMQQGHVASVAAYIKLHTLQPLRFDAVGGVSVEANNEAVAALAGLRSSDILLAHWRNSPYRPCHYVAIDRAAGCVVVSIRGSLQAGDLLSDLSAQPMEVRLLGVEGWVHEGILAAATYIHCTTQAALQEAARRCPGWPVLLTGHSLGGGVASLLAMLIEQSGGLPELGPVRCITLGSAAVMSASLAEACEQTTVSVVVGSDPIPHLSVASVEALLMEASQASPVRRAAEGLRDTLGAVFSMTARAPSAAKEAAWSSLRDVNERMAASGLGGVLSLVVDDCGAQAAVHAAVAAEEATGPAKGRGEATPHAPAGAAAPVEIPVIAASEVEARLAGEPTRAAATAESAAERGPRRIPLIDLSGGEEAAATRYVEGLCQEEERRRGGPAAPQELPASEATAALPEMTAGGGGAGLEGFIVDSAEVQVAEPELGPRPHQVVMMQCGAGVDSGLLAAAMAQESASQPDASDAGYAMGEPGNPELLFPPGRLLWIFPVDAEPWGEAQPGGACGDDLEAATAPRADLEAAWDSAWAGGEAPGNADIPGAGAVDVDEAAVRAAEGSAAEQAATAEAAPTVPVVVDAKRASFGRLLLASDMMTDHLPDRYLDAIRQL